MRAPFSLPWGVQYNILLLLLLLLLLIIIIIIGVVYLAVAATTVFSILAIVVSDIIWGRRSILECVLAIPVWRELGLCWGAQYIGHGLSDFFWKVVVIILWMWLIILCSLLLILLFLSFLLVFLLLCIKVALLFLQVKLQLVWMSLLLQLFLDHLHDCIYENGWTLFIYYQMIGLLFFIIDITMFKKCDFTSSSDFLFFQKVCSLSFMVWPKQMRSSSWAASVVEACLICIFASTSARLRISWNTSIYREK